MTDEKTKNIIKNILKLIKLNQKENKLLKELVLSVIWKNLKDKNKHCSIDEWEKVKRFVSGRGDFFYIRKNSCLRLSDLKIVNLPKDEVVSEENYIKLEDLNDKEEN